MFQEFFHLVVVDVGSLGLVTVALFDVRKWRMDVGLVEKCVTKSGDNKNVNW